MHSDLADKEVELKRLRSELKSVRTQYQTLLRYADGQIKDSCEMSLVQSSQATALVERLKMENEQYQAEMARLSGELTLCQQEKETLHQKNVDLKDQFETTLEEWQSEIAELKQALQDTSLHHASLIQKSESQRHEMNIMMADMQQRLDDLLAENDSYRNLLHEQTMSGQLDLSGHNRRCSGEPMNLADELMSTIQQNDGIDLRERVHTLENDNRALLLYIHQILSRILESDDEAVRTVLSNSHTRGK
jgi:chromosome segregation ATPase